MARRRRSGGKLGWAAVALGVLLDLIGSAALVYGVVQLGDPWIALGQFWFKVHGASLNFLQAIVQRYIAPGLWEFGVVPVLLQPAFAVLALPGALLIVLGLWLRRSRR